MGFYKAGGGAVWRPGECVRAADNVVLRDGARRRIPRLSLHSSKAEKSEDAGSWNHFPPLFYLAAA